MWNNCFQEAEELFEGAKDTKPRSALHYAEIPLLRSFITDSFQDRQEGLARLNQVITLAENHLKVTIKLFSS
jgi:hypothetical protein